MAAAAKLPGVYFAVEPRRTQDELPRMDIAAFVGFAASGPLHVPVAVEDVGRFRDIFGPDVPLAQDEERGEEETSWLGPAVEAFFRQGGRRCWVVRVADEETAVTVDLQVPGLWEADLPPVATGSVGAAAIARSPGWWATELSVGTRLRRERVAPVSGAAIQCAGSVWTVDIALSPLDFAAGDLLELVLPAEGLLFFLFVETAETVISSSDPRLGFERIGGRNGYWYRIRPESPPGPEFPLGADHPSLEPVTAVEAALLQAQAASGSPSLSPTSANRLTFDLLSWRGTTIERRLDGLGFGPGHPRFWGLLPADAPLFEVARGRRLPLLTSEQQSFEAEAASPRFPIAAPATGADRYLPLGMPVIEDPSLAWSPAAPTASRLTFDGLETFSDALFLDRRLRAALTGGLLAEAENRHYVEVFSPGGRPLRGLHSLLPVHEVSMIAAPDAGHRGWTLTPPETPEPLAAPDLHFIPPADELGRVQVSWTGPSEADYFRLEIARTVCFRSPEASERIEAAVGSPSFNAYYFLPTGNCPVAWRFRVRSERLGEVSAWSRTRTAVIPPRHFEECGTFVPGSASLVLRAAPASPEDGIVLVWDYEDADDDLPGDSYELQVSFDPGLAAPAKISSDDPAFDVPARRYDVPLRSDKARYFRIRVVRPEFRGDWSNPVVVNLSNRADWTVLPEAEYDDGALLAIHRGLVRFCAARGDSVAILSLPRHYRATGAREHVGLLLPRVESDRIPALATGALQIPALTTGEEQDGAPSFAAIYHPWTAVALPLEEGNRATLLRVVYVPPDGAAAGTIAARSIQSGAWISPANQPLIGVVALDPRFDIEDWAALTDAQTNIGVEQPRGFLFLNSETLSGREDLRELNVRRLLILLRRLAQREGETFVFETNSDDFRGLVRQRFERWMSDLYVRGAFQGRTPDAGYRVVVDDTVNPPVSVQHGRFLVELRVAPSRPFRFINVRLLQTAPERLTAIEA